jgi:capsular exopolysaccharide synthesis family protein
MSSKSNSIIDSKDLIQIWKLFLKNWYIIFGLMAIAATGAYFYTYKLTDIYAGRTQILIKSAETYDYQSQMYRGLGYYGFYEDITNQQRVITSYDIVSKVISKLDLEVSYFIVGRFKTTEIYETMPFKVNMKVLNNALYGLPIVIKVLDQNTYSISYEINGQSKFEKKFKFQEESVEKDFIIHVSNPGINANNVRNISEIDYFFKVHSKSSLVGKFKSALSVYNIDYTSILQLTLEDEIPSRAVAFLDTLSRVYIDYTLQSKININENTLSYIDAQLNEAIDLMSGIEDDLEQYRSQKAILNLSREENEYFDKLLSFDSQKRKLELQLQSIKALEEYIINASNALDSRLLPPSVFMLENDDFLKRSINELYTQQFQINNSMFDATGISPSIAQNNEKIEYLRRDILVYLSNSKKAFLSKIEDFKIQIKQYEEIIRKIPKTQRDMLNINRQLQVNEKMYLYLLEKKANTIIARAGIIPETKVIEAARSIGVVGPDKKKIYYFLILLAGVLSLVIIFIRAVFFLKIENSEILKGISSLTIFGEIIYAEEAEKEYVVVENNPKAAITESFRSIRANMEYLSTEGNCKTIMISSHNPNEGKTFVSTNLAVIISKAGKKVLLLELDLHKPKVYQGLNMKSEKGITSVLAGKENIEEVVLKSSFDNLDVMLAGPTPPNASELILSKRMEEIINYGKNNYDYLIIDTPPVGLISDALLLMKYADATLFVVNPKIAKKEFILNIEEIVKANQVKNFGFILNGVKLKQSKYYYNYSYGYKYGYKYGYGYGYGESKR